MSQAQDLLNSLEYTSTAGQDNENDDFIVIDNDRQIYVPSPLRRVGVQHDHNVETLTFICPRFWDGNDLSQMMIYINYMLPDGTRDRHPATNVVAGDNTMRFNWIVSNNVTKIKGTLSFLVCIVQVDSEGMEIHRWNSELNQECYISQGMECQDVGLVDYPDIITHLLLRMDEVSLIATPEAMQEYVSNWLDNNSGALLPEIDAKISMKADNLYYDTEASMLYLLSNGEIVGDGINVSAGGSGPGGGSSNNAVLTLQNLTGWSYKNVSQNSECKLSFNWTSTEDGTTTGPGAVTVKVGGVLRHSATIEQGPVEIDVSKYLSTGSNSVRLSVSDIYGNSRTIAYTINVISLTLTSSFDASVAYTGAITFPYVPTGAVEKTVRFILDGTEIGHAVTNVSGRQQSFTIPAQAHGSHTLHVYFEADIDGETVPSNGLYYDIICLETGNTSPIITSPFREDKAEQYVTFAIQYRVYDPQSLTSSVTLYANDTEISTLTVDRTEHTWSYRPDTSGEFTLRIVCAGASGSVATKEFKMEVAESQIDAEVTTEDLALYLTAQGRSNNEENPAVWNSGDIQVRFSGFNFKTDGWHVDEEGATVMRVAGDARLTIPYRMFANDFRTSGKTIEIEFATQNVLNYDGVLLSCMSGGRGLEVTTQKATLKSEQSSIGTQYKEEEHVRLSFVVEKKSSTKLLLCYINGILSGSVQYPDDDDFSQGTPVDISIGTSECTTDIYNIRVYDNDLTRHQILDNWIGDTQNGILRKERYERNNIYDDYGSITIDTLKKDLPYLVITCPALPTFKGDKKGCSGYYVDPVDNTKSFTFEGAEIDVQGTSSQYYYKKNFKIKFKGGFTLYDGNTSETYQLKPGTIPTDVFTFKADVASSEGANNVILAQIYNDLCPVKTPPQEADSRVRQTIDGHPIAIFWDNGTDVVFYAKFNFNHDKGTEEVFGFTPGDESWEILQNGTERTGFRSADFSGDDWKNDFEARYPEDNVDTTKLAAFAEWLVSTDANAATNEAFDAAITYDGVEYTTDSAEYRLAKFKAEAEDHMNLEAMVYYYVITELFLCIDQREKNAFPTLWKDDPQWWMLFYDADSSLGIDNKGNLAFDYYLEDIDYTEAGDPVFNGQASVLWVNLRECFYSEIEAEYKRLRTTNRSDGSGRPLLSYDVVNDLFEAHQSKWSEAIYNEDGYNKSIEPYVLNGDTLYLPMLQGKKEQQRKWWLYNRFRYLDSKYNTGSSMDTRITMRAHAQGNIKLRSYVNMYGHVYYNAEMSEHRMYRNAEEPYEFVWAATGAEDAVIGINDADMLTSLGDLSPLMIELADISKATHLTELKLGDASADYVNRNLNSITLGNNILLKKMDFRNCVSLTQAVDASGCTGLEEAYFDGTSITALSLPNGGNLRVLHLPGTVTNLTIRNQSKLEEFVMSSYENVATLWIENVGSAVNTFEILNAIPASSRVRLIGITLPFTTIEELTAFCALLDTMRGIDESGNNTDRAQISGRVHINSLTSQQLYEIRNRYPGLTITYNTITLHTVKFWNGSTLLKTVENVHYHSSVEYDGADPIKEGETDHSKWEFIGWDPDPSIVTGDMDCYAQYQFTGLFSRELVQRTIEGAYENDRVEVIGDYAFYDSNKLTSVSFPNAISIGAGAFQNCDLLENLYFPNVATIGANAFRPARNNRRLKKVSFPKATIIPSGCFYYCSSISEVDFPLAESIGGEAFGQSLIERAVFPSVKTVESLGFRYMAKLTRLDLPVVESLKGAPFGNDVLLNTLIIRNQQMVCAATNSGFLNGTAIAAGTGYVYVPRALVNSYKTASNWSEYANQIRAIEDYPEICGGDV